MAVQDRYPGLGGQSDGEAYIDVLNTKRRSPLSLQEKKKIARYASRHGLLEEFLPADEQDIVRRRFLAPSMKQPTIEEIAAARGTGVGTAKTQEVRAFRKLSFVLRERGIVFSVKR